MFYNYASIRIHIGSANGVLFRNLPKYLFQGPYKNWKWEVWPPAEIVTTDNFILKLCPRRVDYPLSKFWYPRLRWGFSHDMWNITASWLYWLFCPFYSFPRWGRTTGSIWFRTSMV